MRIRCNWCSKPVKGKPNRYLRRNFCCRDHVTAWQKFQTRVFENTREAPSCEVS